MTEEEKKRKKADYDRKYRERNAEHLAKLHKAWREKNADYKAKKDKEWREQNKERKYVTGAKWFQENKDRYRAIDLKRNYGLTVEQYDAMHSAQGGKCAICGGVNANGKRLAVDHDHDTGKARELLCLSCNLVIGHAKDKPETLRLAALYLEKHGRT